MESLKKYLEVDIRRQSNLSSYLHFFEFILLNIQNLPFVCVCCPIEDGDGCFFHYIKSEKWKQGENELNRTQSFWFALNFSLNSSYNGSFTNPG